MVSVKTIFYKSLDLPASSGFKKYNRFQIQFGSGSPRFVALWFFLFLVPFLF